MTTTLNGHRPGAAASEQNGDDAKRLANLKARCAIAGIALHQLDDGGYLAFRWNLTRELPDLDAAEYWLAQTTGARA